MTEDQRIIPALSCGLVGFDTETTGPNPTEDSIVTAAITMMGPTGRIRKRLTWLINSHKEISDGAAAVHGITNEKKAAEGVPPAPALAEIASILRACWHLNLPVVIYNAPFDITILNEDLARHAGKPLFDGIDKPLIIDPLVIDKQLDKYRKGSRKLIDTASLLGIHLGADEAHDACFDAIAACHVALGLYRQHISLQQMNAEQLMISQAKWFHEQMTSLEAYKQKTDKTFRVQKDWPLQGMLGRTAPKGNWTPEPKNTGFDTSFDGMDHDEQEEEPAPNGWG